MEEAAASAPQQTSNTNAKPRLTASFSLFKPSTESVKLNLETFILLLVVPTVLSVALNINSRFHNTAATQYGATSSGLSNNVLGLGLATVLITLIIYPGLIVLRLRSAQNVKMSAGEAVKAGLGYFWRLVGLAIVTGLVVFIGLLLLIVPAFIFIRRYYLAPYYVVDQNVGILEAMRRSAADSKPVAGYIWGVIGVTAVFSLPSIIPVLGNVVTIILDTLYTCAGALRYLEIQKALHPQAVTAQTTAAIPSLPPTPPVAPTIDSPVA